MRPGQVDSYTFRLLNWQLKFTRTERGGASDAAK